VRRMEMRRMEKQLEAGKLSGQAQQWTRPKLLNLSVSPCDFILGITLGGMSLGGMNQSESVTLSSECR